MITKRILIADDDPLVRNVLRFFLESQTRFKVCGEAVNGLDVIEKARTLNPDLIVMDFSMPVMNGIETGSVLKVMLPQVPIVLYHLQPPRLEALTGKVTCSEPSTTWFLPGKTGWRLIIGTIGTWETAQLGKSHIPTMDFSGLGRISKPERTQGDVRISDCCDSV
jgi:Response regulator receiver domain